MSNLQAIENATLPMKISIQILAKPESLIINISKRTKISPFRCKRALQKTECCQRGGSSQLTGQRKYHLTDKKSQYKYLQKKRKSHKPLQTYNNFTFQM